MHLHCLALASRLTSPASVLARISTRFIQNIRQRVIGVTETSTVGYGPYRNAIQDAFGNRMAHGTLTKIYSVTHLSVTEASRYSPAAVIAVARDVVSGLPAENFDQLR